MENRTLPEAEIRYDQPESAASPDTDESSSLTLSIVRAVLAVTVVVALVTLKGLLESGVRKLRGGD